MDNENDYTPKNIQRPGEMILGQDNSNLPKADAIGPGQLAKFTEILQKYKQGKTNLEQKIIENEEWWKLRHWKDHTQKFVPATAWLWNTIQAKHADMEDGFPEPNILPREEGDKQEAEILSSIVPVILDQAEFHKVYSDCCWQKLKQGAAIYGIFWDGSAINGIGSIVLKRIDILNLFWEPGITDIQASQYIFHTELVDNDILKQKYPQLQDKHLDGDRYVAKYLYDDGVDTSEKSTIIDVYYHRHQGNKEVLHYCKYIGDTVLYATENETTPPSTPVMDQRTGQPMINPQTGEQVKQPTGQSMSQRGLYDHNKYPFVVDSLFDIEGTPIGYSYIDICRDTQTSIDQLNQAIVENTLMAAKRRYFALDDLDIKLEDFADWNKDIVSVSSPMSDERLREITVNPLDDIYVAILNNQIDMLKETSGNRDVNNGGTTSGVTSASGIAALQEASSKSSRDTLTNTYEAYKEICIQVIELIRQFFDTPRQFRIVGESGMQKFVTYDNAGLQPQYQGNDFGIDMGYRVPQFDIKVTAQKSNPYSKVSQNELMLQFFGLGFFNPHMADQALACIQGMDFEGKDDVITRVQRNGTMLQNFQMLVQIAMGLAGAYDQRFLPQIQQMAQSIGMDMTAMPQNQGNASIPSVRESDALGETQPEEHPFVQQARERAQNATQPET